MIERHPAGPSSWTDAHLALDAVVAFVDDELSPGAQDRAAAHLARCPGCAVEVAAQRQARSALRRADTPHPPAELLSALRAIPLAVPVHLPSSGAGAPVPPSSPVPPPRSVPPPMPAPGSDAPAPFSLARSRSRRAWQAAAAAGLALGALVAVGPAAAPHSDEPTAPADPGGGGASLLGRDAALSPAPARPAGNAPASVTPDPVGTGAGGDRDGVSMRRTLPVVFAPRLLR